MTNTFIVIALSMLTLSAPLVAHAEWVLGTVVLVPNDAPQPPVLEFSTGGKRVQTALLANFTCLSKGR